MIKLYNTFYVCPRGQNHHYLNHNKVKDIYFCNCSSSPLPQTKITKEEATMLFLTYEFKQLNIIPVSENVVTYLMK